MAASFYAVMIRKRLLAAFFCVFTICKEGSSLIISQAYPRGRVPLSGDITFFDKGREPDGGLFLRIYDTREIAASLHVFTTCTERTGLVSQTYPRGWAMLSRASFSNKGREAMAAFFLRIYDTREGEIRFEFFSRIVSRVGQC